MSQTGTGNEEYVYKWVILGILTGAQVFMSMAAYAWGPLAPFLVEEFCISRAQVGSLTSALYLASVLIAIPSGFWVDKFGARIMLVICLLIMGISFTFISLSIRFSAILFFAFLCGLGYGVINQVSTKGIMIWFSAKARATAMGIKQMGVTGGGAIVAVLIPALSLTYGWRSGVFVTGLLMLVMMILSLLLYRERPPAIAGSEKHERALKSGAGQKVTLLQVIADPNMRIICVAIPLMAFAQTCIASFLVLFMEEAFSLTKVLAGSFLTVFMITGAAGRIGWGVVSDRLFRGDRHKPLIILASIAFASTLGLAFSTSGVPLWVLYIISALLGLTFMGWNALLMTLVAEIAGAELAGSVMGVMVTIAWMGIVAGPPVFGFVADTFGYVWSWLMLAVFGAVNIICFTWINLRNKKGGKWENIPY